MFLNKLTRFVKTKIKHAYLRTQIKKPPWRVLFFGTDEFSVASLQALHSVYRKGDLLNRLEVVTSVKSKSNAVEKFATKQSLVLHKWPISSSLCDGFDVGLVVSFGHLIPNNIIKSFPLGMLNVHASLLPRWRGAAPIIYALANGDKKTAVTIMKIEPFKFDVGDIIVQVPVDICDHWKMPDLHYVLAELGARTLVSTIDNLVANLSSATSQSEDGVTFAPRVNSKMAYVAWNKMSANDVFNLERALTGLFHLTTQFGNMPVKLHNVTKCEDNIESRTNVQNTTLVQPGLIMYDKMTKRLRVQCADGNWVNVEKVGIPGKKMTAADFKNGFLNKQAEQMLFFR